MLRNAKKSKVGIARFVICTALLGLTSACSPFNSRDDQIRVQSVHLIRKPDRVPDSDKGVVMVAPVIQVSFSANINLDELANHGWSISIATALCRKPDTPEWPLRVDNFGYVFDEFGIINIYRPKHSRSPHASIQYHFYLVPARSEISDGPKYDLIHDPKNVCFQIVALKENIPIISETINRSSRSNVVMLPARLFVEMSEDTATRH